MVVRVTGLDIFLSTVEYGLRRQQLCKDAANRPDVWKKNSQTRISGCAYAQECRWARAMRNSHRWLWCNAEPRAKAPALCTRKWPPPGQDRLKASAVNWRVGQIPCQLQDGGGGQIRESYVITNINNERRRHSLHTNLYSTPLRTFPHH